MTVAVETTKSGPYAGSGTTGPFTYSFKIFAATDLEVIKYDSAGTPTTLTYATHYTVTGVGVATGGTVTLTTALPVGESLVIRRSMDYLQSQNYTTVASISPANLNNTFDKLEMQIQQVNEKADRSFQLPVDTTLTTPYLRPSAGNMIGWDASGTGLKNYPTASITVPVIDHVGNYSDNLSSAVEAIGSAKQLLVIDKAITLTASVTVPTTLQLCILKGGSITTTGYTLTINGPFEAGDYQVFSGTGTVTFGTGIPIVRASWFGTTGTAIQAAVNSLAGYGTVVIGPGTWPITSIITTKDYITIRGSGIESTTLSSIGVATSIFGSTTAIMQKITFCDMTLWGDATSLALLDAEKGMHTCKFYRVRFLGAPRLMTLVSDNTARGVSYNIFEDCVFYSSATDYMVSISKTGGGWATFNRFTRCQISSNVAGTYGIYLSGASAIFDQCELAGGVSGAKGIKLDTYGRAHWKHSHLELSGAMDLVHDIEYGSTLRVDENQYLAMSLSNADYRIMDKSYDINGFFQTIVDGADKDFIYFSKNLFPNPQFFNTTSSTLDGWVTNCGSLAISADEYPDSMASGSRVLELTALSSQATNYIQSAEIDVKGLLPAHAGFDHRFYLELRVYMPAGASTTNQILRVLDNAFNYFISNSINDQLTAGEWNTIRVVFRTPAAYVAGLTWIRVSFSFTEGGAPTSNEVWKFTRPILKAISVSPLPLDSEIIKLASAPADGTWQVGAVVFNSAPAVSEYAGWICTVGGTPGTWRGFGYIPNKGATAARPVPAATDYGVMYLDTTLDADGLPIFWQGTKWIKADGSDA